MQAVNIEGHANRSDPLPGDYASRRLRRRSVHMRFGLGFALLFLVRQAIFVGLIPALMVGAGVAVAFASLVLLVRARANRAAGDDCSALLPVWAASRAGAEIRVKNPEAEIPGTLQFSTGCIEWIPTSGGRRMGAESLRWKVRTSEQVGIFDAGRLSSQMLVSIYGPAGNTEADVWARATKRRVQRLLALAVPESVE
jgi:hypothetical protein